MKRALLLIALLAGHPLRAPAQLPHTRTGWWQTAGVGTLLVATFAADQELREQLYVQSDGSRLGLARQLSALAQPTFMASSLALTYGVGQLTHDARLRTASERGAVAVGVATAASGIIKIAVGRARPDAGADPDALYPGSFVGKHQSFPSGHTAVAFALAATAAHEFHGTIPAVVAFTTATAVGWSRVYRNVHWSSDVVAAAVVGVAAARMAARLVADPGSENAPHLDVWDGGVGIRVPLPRRSEPAAAAPES